jgi:predicted deacylase
MRRFLLIAFAVTVGGTTPLAADETLDSDLTPRLANASATRVPMPARNRPSGDEAEPFELVGERIPPGSFRRLSWAATELFDGVSLATPVLVAHGAHPGQVLCLTAAVHGDELNGIEIVRRILHGLEPTGLTGTVVGVPIVNIQAFRRGSRYLPDRRDLNRHFPGSPDGSAASRIAHSLFSNIVTHCDALVDLHTGSMERTNLPQLRADLSHAGVATLTKGFGATVVVNSQPRVGTLRSAATRAGIPTLTFEAGGPEQLDPEEIAHGVRGIEALLHSLGMVSETRPRKAREATYVSSSWVRADVGGILMSEIELGSEVRKGDVLGRLIDPITNEITAIHAPGTGRIIGMARNQIVMPGFATYHIGTDGRGKSDRVAPPMPDHEPSDTSE